MRTIDLELSYSEQQDNIDLVKCCKDKVEVKASWEKDGRKGQACLTTLVMITNLNLGRCTDDRKEMLNL
jgi:hypothetical protein